jgi:hypothetical protein
MISLMVGVLPRKNSLTVVSLVLLRGFCEIRSYCAIGRTRVSGYSMPLVALLAALAMPFKSVKISSAVF